MIKVTKDEAEFVRGVMPDAHFSHTVHKTYVEETEAVLRLLPNNKEASAALRELRKDELRRKSVQVTS